MASTSETGHGKNLAIFQELIILLKGYPDYQPSNPAIQIPQLESLRDTAIAAAETLITKTAQYKHAVNKRQEIFANLKTLSTRIINILDSSVNTDDIVKDARVFHRKIHSMRASSPKPQSPNLPPKKQFPQPSYPTIAAQITFYS